MLVVSRIYIAVKILRFLANNLDARVITQIMSDEMGVPLPYLRKVAHQLIRAKMIAAVRGPNGGLVLARPASQIHLGEIWTVIDQTRRSKRNKALPQDEGVPPRIIEEALQKFVDVLNEHTLADLPKSVTKGRAPASGDAKFSISESKAASRAPRAKPGERAAHRD